MIHQEILTIKQVAKVLQVEPVTVRRKISAQKLEAFRTNGDSGPYRISRESLDRYMSEGSRMVEVGVQ